MNPSSVHHLVRTLCEEGILTKDHRNKYRLGWKLLEWSSLVMYQQEIYDEAIPWVEELVQQFRETVHIGMFDKGEFIFTLKVASKHSTSMPTFVGARNPAYCFSTGKVLLSYNQSFVESAIAKGLIQRAPNTITNPEKLEKELETIRKQGFAISDNENELGLYGLAAPIRSYTGKIVAALNIVGPTSHMKGRNIDRIVQSLVNAANSISKELGYVEV